MRFYWRGNAAANKDLWANGENWNLDTGPNPDAGRYPGSVLGTEDEAWFDAAIPAPALGPKGVSGAGWERLSALLISKYYDGAFGSVGTSIGISARRVVVDSVGMPAPVYLAGGVIDSVVQASGSLGLSGDVQDVICIGGTLTAGCYWLPGGKLIVGSAVPNTGTGLVTIPTDPGETVKVVQYAGDLTSYAKVDLSLSSGTARLHKGGGEVRVTGGSAEWYAGDVDLLECFGGSFKAFLTLTGTVELLRVGGSGVVNLDNGIASAGYTALEWLGGTFYPGRG